LPERAKLIAEEWKALDAEEKEVSLLACLERRFNHEQNADSAHYRNTKSFPKKTSSAMHLRKRP